MPCGLQVLHLKLEPKLCVRNGSQALIGKNATIPEGLLTCAHGAFMSVLRARNTSFVYQLFQTDHYSKQVAGDLGAAINSINGSNLIRYRFPLPSLPEQQKIADCLSSLDDLIRAEEGRLEALRDHKTGLTQRLFPAQGATTPRLRFPEFRNAGPWEVKRLGDREIARFMRERVAGDDIPLGHYVSTVNLSPDFCGLSPEPEKPPAGSAIAYREGDILMSNIRPYLRKVWVADRSGGASNDVLVARPAKSVAKSFLSQLLMSERFISHVMSGAKGVKMPRGDLEQIQDFEVPLPTRPEQQKIADCLIALDDLVRAQGETIEALKAHKRGLMQQLFPREVG
jgi:type I restriction enzyme S subunit